jgi:hypothetical protein
MADVTTTFAAKDESFASTVDRLQQRLTGFGNETTSFTERVAAMGAGFSRLAGPIIAAGAAFLGAQSAAQAFRDALSMAGRLDDLSKATGASAGELAILGKAFELGGSSADKLAPLLQRLNAFLGEAIDPASAQAKALTALGLTFVDLQGKTPTQVLETLTQRLAAIEDPTVRAALSQAVFKKAAVDIAPMIGNLSDEVARAAQYLGSLPDELNKSAGAMADFEDDIKGISEKFTQFAAGLLSRVIPALSAVSEALSGTDAAGMGAGIGQAFSDQLERIVGLARMTGPEIASALFGNMKDSILVAAETFTSSMLTATNRVRVFLETLFSGGAGSGVNALSDNFANALINAAARFGVKFFDVLSDIGNSLNLLLAGNASFAQNAFSKAFSAVISAFSNDLVQFLSNPIAFVAGSLGKALTGAAQSSAADFQFGYDNAFGTTVQKLRGGLQNVVDQTGSRMESSSSFFNEKVTQAAQKAADGSNEVQTNFFGGAEAAQRIQDRLEKAKDNSGMMLESGKGTEKHSEGVSKNTTDAKAALQQALEAMKGAETSSDKVSKNGRDFANSIKEAESASEKLAENLSGPKSLSGLDAKAQKESGDLREALGRLRDYVKEDGAMRQYNREQDSAQRTLDRKLDEAAKLRERGFDFAAAEKEARARDQFTQRELASRYDLLSKTKLQDDLERAARKQSYGEELEARRKAFNDYEERQKRAGDYVNEKMRDAANRNEEALLGAANDFFNDVSAGGSKLKGDGSDAGGYLKQGGADAASALRDAVGLKAGHKPWFSGGGELDFIKDLKAQGKGQDPMASALSAINKALETLTKYIVSDDRLPQNAIGY